MGIARRPGKVKLIAGFLFTDNETYSSARSDMVRLFGRTDFESATIDFTHTSYYEEEMGPGLKRRFVSFEKPVDLRGICAVKVRTNRLEKRYAKEGLRTVNIDPGYLDLSKLVLFSTKDYSHRIYLDKSIFAEVTLFYKDSRFNSWPWTYPDYKSAEYLSVFETIRQIYKEQREGGSRICR